MAVAVAVAVAVAAAAAVAAAVALAVAVSLWLPTSPKSDFTVFCVFYIFVENVPKS